MILKIILLVYLVIGVIFAIVYAPKQFKFKYVINSIWTCLFWPNIVFLAIKLSITAIKKPQNIVYLSESLLDFAEKIQADNDPEMVEVANNLRKYSKDFQKLIDSKK